MQLRKHWNREQSCVYGFVCGFSSGLIFWGIVGMLAAWMRQ
jgi:hypothetical protein